jgi:hypothetical protein
MTTEDDDSLIDLIQKSRAGRLSDEDRDSFAVATFRRRLDNSLRAVTCTSLTGREHDGGVRAPRRPRSEPPAGFFDISCAARGRPEAPQPIGHSLDLTEGYMDLAMFCRRQRRHGWGLPLIVE